ncbi:peptide-methionine (S)-S-oxide reductase [Parvularcula maris]|uniref:peptide-methionine (S)-S-oxide reductase n=1 Tax=Parvularcula maris TaxID=2965077 RepID=A0A9X2L860_9PROT|nr:peptide-methionine (S)-S-oxide reductase [Parvularcula maris]MCQ8184736.1 peptide-methionine (S)-S-oxide reductase [Parvularcula maris]
MKINELGLGGGCHWCTEAVFQSLRGVSDVRQGFLWSDPPDDAPSEGVLLQVDREIIPLAALLEIHLRTHASGSDHSMREKYRSAVYVTNEEMAGEVTAVLGGVASSLGFEPVTKVLPLRGFQLNEKRFLNYRRSRPDAPFCRTYIDPKLALLRREYTEYIES